MTEKTLSDSFIVLCEIYHQNFTEKPITFTKLVEILDPILSREIIAHSLNELDDWFLIEGKYGETKPGHAGWHYFITEQILPKAKEIYEEYWKEQRKILLGVN